MDGYTMDPTEQEFFDDTPFVGGSTEQRDAFLGEKLGSTRVGSKAFHQAMQIAGEQLLALAPTVINADEELAALEALVQRVLPCASLHIFRGNLYAERRHQVGRPLTEAEVVRIDAYAQQYWAVLHGVAA